MNTSMDDFSSPFQVNPFQTAQELDGSSVLRMMPYDSTSSKIIHKAILDLDPEVFRGHRQIAMVSILRCHRYILAAMPAAYQARLGETPPILGYCAFHEVEFTNNSQWFRIVSMGVVPDQRNMGLATRLLRRVAMFGSNNVYATFNPTKHLDMACFLKRRGAVIQPFAEGISMFKVHRANLFQKVSAKT